MSSVPVMKKYKDICIKVVASFFFLGYSPIASGTVGTLGGVLIVYYLRDYPLSYTIFTFSLIMLGMYVSNEAEHIYREKDSHKIVIDEVIGYLVAMMWLPHYSVIIMIIGFFVNRVFDILKPYPIRKLEQLPGGVGVVMDDVLAGVYTNIVLRIIMLLTVV